MITVYHRHENVVSASPLAVNGKIPPGTIWMDVHNITPEEEKCLEEQLGIDIPTREEIWKNRVLNRFYEENGVYYMSAAIITKVETPHPLTSTVTFILSDTYLVTIRYITPTSFKNFSDRLLRSTKRYKTSERLLEGLLSEMITRVAHNSEIVVQDLDRLSHDIFNLNSLSEGKQTQSVSAAMRDVLKTLGTCADLNSKINESLHSITRLLSFLEQAHKENADLAARIQLLSKDTKSLSQQTGFLADKITFLLDATLGMINVEQNIIIKIFSVIAAFFLPPTLISSIYGMNFQHMPELHWVMGYPFALTMIMVCALIPYFYFRKRGWL
jgi:magnesium transporter